MKVENLVLNVIIVDGKVDNIGDILKKHITDIVSNSKTIVVNGSESAVNDKVDNKTEVEKTVNVPVYSNVSSGETHSFVEKDEKVKVENIDEKNTNTSTEKIGDVKDETLDKSKEEKEENNIVDLDMDMLKNKIIKFGYYSYTYSSELAIYALVNKGITKEEFNFVCPNHADKNLADLITLYQNALIRNVDLPHDSKFRVDMTKIKKVASTSEIVASILDVPAGCICEIEHDGVSEVILLRLNSAKNAFHNYGNIVNIFGSKLSCITVGGVNKKHKELFPNSTGTVPVYF